MPIQQTSIDAFIEEEHRLGEMEQLVYDGFKRHGPHTDKEMAFLLGFVEGNKVRPRRNSLVEKGLIISLGKRKCDITGKTVIIWGSNERNNN